MKALRGLLLGVCILVFLGTGAYLLKEYLTESKAEGELERLTRMVEQNLPTPTQTQADSASGTDDASGAVEIVPQTMAPAPMAMTVLVRESDIQSPPDHQQQIQELATMVQDFLRGNVAFENQPIQVIRLEITRADAAKPDSAPSVRVLVDGQAVFSPAKQSQINRLTGMIAEHIGDEPGWAEAGTELIDLDISIEAAPILPQYAPLYEENSDIVGWIRIEGTRVNYPVMQTREDPEFYLRTNFEKEYSYSGLPFLDARCDLTERSINQLVYGHNMKSGNMFGQLPEYQSRNFYQNHKIIHFDLLNQQREYEVMAMFRSRQYAEGEQGFRYYDYIDLSEWSVYRSFVDQAKAASMIDTGVTAQFGDELITLSTCSYHANDGTFVVVAKRVK